MKGNYIKIIALTIILWSTATLLSDAKTVYVVRGGKGTRDGSSWYNAAATVSDGLIAAASGDEVWVTLGTYEEAVTLREGVALYGGFPPSLRATPLDRNPNLYPTVIQAPERENHGVLGADDALIDGFFLGRKDGYLKRIGLVCENTSPVIANCTIEGFAQSKTGGSVKLTGSSAQFLNCTIRGNASYGGCSEYASVTTQGAGVYCISSSPVFDSCRIVDNQLAIGYRSGDCGRFGGGIYCEDSSAEFINCVIGGNSGAEKGTGAYFENCIVTLTNCTIAGNTPGAIARSVSAVECVNTSLTAVNCVFSNHGEEISKDSSSAVSLSHCCLDRTWEGDGNIDAFPRFYDMSNGDYRLQNGSPCIDRGLLSSGPAEDINGIHRPGEDGLVDMGAFESPDEYVPSDRESHAVRVRLGANTGGDGSSWADAVRSVAEAIVIASPSQEIWVAAGQYKEAIYLEPGTSLYGGFSGSETSRGNRDWDLNETIIDAAGLERSAVVSAEGALLDGVTITGGSTQYGGGIHCAGCSMSIANCTVTGNAVARRHYTDDGKGAGLYISDSSVSLTNCTVSNNILGYGPYHLVGTGAGICCEENSSVELTGCTIVHNTADYVSDAGGVYCRNSTMKFSDCELSDNYADGNIGGGIYSEESETAFLNCVISRNGSNNNGGGVFLRTASASFVNCLLAGNWSESSGGTFMLGSSSLSLLNCTIADGRSEKGGGIFAWFSDIDIVNCILSNHGPEIIDYRYGGTYPDNTFEVRYSCFQDSWPGEGNISAAPVFVDPDAGDYSLQNGSPCIDRGLLAEAPETDVLGRSRPGNDGLVDMGAFESPEEYLPGSLEHTPRVFYISPDADEGGDGTSWRKAKRSMTDALRFTGVGDELWVRKGTYEEATIMEPGVALYGGFTGVESLREERNAVANPTVIDVGSLNEADGVTGAEKGVLEGFTVKGPKYYGAGIMCYLCSPTIRDCTITACEDYALFGYHSSAQVNKCVITGNGLLRENGNTVYFRYDSPEIRDCVIRGNRSGGAGGGIDIWETFGKIVNCDISDNRSGSAGGGVSFYEDWSYFLNCRITNNVTTGYGGGGVAIEGGGPTFVNCEISGNRVTGYRGGVAIHVENFPWFSFVSRPRIYNCTIAGNDLREGYCAALYAGENCWLKIANCILWNENREVILWESKEQVDTSFSCVRNGWPGDGNTDQDPQFVKPWDGISGDFRLTNTSPCLDTGARISDIDDDLDGLPRPVDIRGVGFDGENWGFDMGAYELQPAETITATHTPTPTCTPTPRPPVANLQAKPSAGRPPLAVNFVADATGPDVLIKEYQWIFEMGVTSDIIPVTAASVNAIANHIYRDEGTHRAGIRVMDQAGNVTTVYKNIYAIDGDLDGSGEMNGNDLLLCAKYWMQPASAESMKCNVHKDDRIDIQDLLALMHVWKESKTSN